MSIDISKIREQFPSLSITDEGKPRIYFDNPAGTQVPRQMIDRTVECLIEANANTGGYFTTTRKVQAIIDDAHQAMADLLNAPSPDEIIFGQNMTSLTFHISRSLGHELQPEDEIVVTRKDHEGNVSPWLLLARDKGCKVRWLDFDPDTFEYDLSRLDEVITDRTRIVAVNYASNLTGTINDVKTITARARQKGAYAYVDAVQYAPHGLIDVQDIGCDFLVCSAYKFFGPHQGVLWGRRDVLEKLLPYKVRPAREAIPHRFETGTQSHEAMAGTLGAIEYLAWLGETMGSPVESRNGETPRRKQIRSAMQILSQYERELAYRLILGLRQIPGISIQGIVSSEDLDRRVPTISITHRSKHPQQLARALSDENIFVWSGHNYAVELVKRLGLIDKGGVLRIGLSHYNTPKEVDHTLNILEHAVKN